MTPTTRLMLKKARLETKPYSKENRPSEKKTPVNFVPNNAAKALANATKTNINVKKSNERIFKTGNIIKTEKASKVTEIKNSISKPVVTNKIETRSSTKETLRASLNSSKNSTLYQSTNEESIDSDHSEKTQELYVSAVDSSNLSSIPFENNHSDLYHTAVQELSTSCDENEIFEIDQIHWNNFMYVGCYASEIFKYLRLREDQFKVTNYISGQSEITPKHRMIVVNWLVSLQEVNELSHEVLYMAVKLIDLYLMKNDTSKDKFQLLASGALLISSKIDIREPGFPYELVRQSNYSFTEDELFVTERELVKSVNFDINFPLSYVFLRRFARCMHCKMILLTLARYILECSLLEYKFAYSKESLKAAAALYLAFQMCSTSVNLKEFRKFTGYDISEIKDTVIALNIMLHTESPNMSSVKEKYIHKIFFRVASKPLLSNSNLTFN